MKDPKISIISFSLKRRYGATGNHFMKYFI